MDNNTRKVRLSSFNCKSIKRSSMHVRDLCGEVDILALQETWLLPYEVNYVHQLDNQFSCYSTSAVDLSTGVLRGRPYGGLALMWRKSLFPNVSLVNCNSDRIIAIKVTTGSQSFLVFSVYMPYDKEEHLVDFTNCLATVSAVLSDTDVEVAYVLGDFNAHPGARFGRELLDFCRSESLHCADIDILGMDSGNYTFTCESSGSRRWLDHCVTTGAGMSTIRSVTINNDVFWSDHNPILIEIDLDAVIQKSIYNFCDSIRNKIVWNNKSLDQINEYGRLCFEQFAMMCDLSSPCLCDCNTVICSCTNDHKNLFIDSFYNKIVTILQEASIATTRSPTAPSRHRQVTGWNYHVKSAYQTARQKHQWWVACGRPMGGDLYRGMIESRRNFKNKLKWCLNNENSIKMNVLAINRANKNFSKFWKATKALNYKDVLPVAVNDERDPGRIANMFASHFKIQPLEVEEVDDAGPTDSSGHSIVSQFSANDIAKVVRNMKRGKSPGHDGLSVEHILYASEKVFAVLAGLFNLCLSRSYLPKELMKTVVTPIVKNKTGDLSDAGNYRPISVGTIIGKVFESLLQPELAKNLKLDDAQFGFRTGLSTDSAILSLKYAVNYYVNRDTTVYACFLDLSRAFDLVNYSLLWKKMVRARIPNEITSIMRFWYENQNNCVRWGDTTSNNFRLDCGVRQGGLTSPDLFNLYINDLIEELRSSRIGCHVGNVCINNLSYADDMVLLSPSINGIRKLLSICERYSKLHGLKYNIKKTELLVFRAGKGPEKVLPVYLYETPVRVVASFKYLGHVLTDRLTDDEDMERERRALAIRCNMLARRFAKCSKDVKITLFRAFCQCFYTCPLWVKFTKRTFGVLRVQYNDAFRILMRHPRFCSAKGMFAEERVPDFFAIMRSRAASFWTRLQNSSNTILKRVADDFDNVFIKHWSLMHRRGNGKV